MFGTGIPTHPKKFPPLGSVGLQYFSDRYWKYLLVLHVSLYRYHLRSVNMIFPIWVCGVSGIKISSVYRGKVVSKCRLTDLWKDVFSTLRIDIFPQTLMTFLSGSNMILSQTLMIQVCFFWGLKWVFFYKHGAIGQRYGLRRWWIECWQSLPGNENNVILLKSESGNGRGWQQGSTSQKRNELFDKLDWVALERVGK